MARIARPDDDHIVIESLLAFVCCLFMDPLKYFSETNLAVSVLSAGLERLARSDRQSFQVHECATGLSVRTLSELTDSQSS